MLGVLGAVAPMVKTLFSTIDKTIDNKAEAEKNKTKYSATTFIRSTKRIRSTSSNNYC